MNSTHGVHAMLRNRWTLLGVRGKLESGFSSSPRRGADARRAILSFVEDCIYRAADGVVVDEMLPQWLDKFDKSHRKAVLNTSAKTAANSDTNAESEVAAGEEAPFMGLPITVPGKTSGQNVPPRALLRAGEQARMGSEGEAEQDGLVRHRAAGQTAGDEPVEQTQDLERPARSSWTDEMRRPHITHLELEAVYKTIHEFLRELEYKVIRLYYANQAVVAMLSHCTSMSRDAMRRTRRLWGQLGLNHTEVQARCICMGVAPEKADFFRGLLEALASSEEHAHGPLLRAVDMVRVTDVPTFFLVCPNRIIYVQ
eukprot:gene13848-biopygen14251